MDGKQITCVSELHNNNLASHRDHREKKLCGEMSLRRSNISIVANSAPKDAELVAQDFCFSAVM